MNHFLSAPKGLKRHWGVVAPLILSQTAQFLFHFVDTVFVSRLGKEVSLIHLVQSNFTMVGQTLGMVTATCCLVFWNSPENVRKRSNLRQKLESLSFISGVILIFIFATFSNTLISHFQIPQEFSNLARNYFYCGFFNLLFYSLLGPVSGVLIASGRQKLWGTLLLLNIFLSGIVNYCAIRFVPVPADALMIIGVSTSVLLLACWLYGFWVSHQLSKGEEKFAYSELLKIWCSELGFGFVRTASPFIFSILIARTSGGFLLTYQFTLQMVVLFFIPLFAALQIAIRDASANQPWWGAFLYTGLLPSVGLTFIALLFYPSLLYSVFHYSVPLEHRFFLVLFCLTCLITQVADTGMVFLRASKRSGRLLANLILAEGFVLVGGYSLVQLGYARSNTIGWLLLAYSFVFFTLQAFSTRAFWLLPLRRGTSLDEVRKFSWFLPRLSRIER